uniref:Glycine N-acyltransferase-like protein n=1 Tax=Acrobeloides nanus TaxID=290746 RepID=A0A914BWA0_9BILA
MLKLLSTKAELEEALEKTRLFPDFIIAHQIIENKLHDRFSEAKMTVLSYKNSDGINLWIVVRESVPFILLACRVEDKFDRNVLFEVFDEFAKMFPQVYEKEATVMGHEIIINLYEEWHKKTFPLLTNSRYPNYLYYSTEEQKQKFLEVDIKLPEGYQFSEVNFENDDIEKICSTWAHATDGDMEIFRAKLRNMPYSLIRDRNNSLVAYEMLEMSSLFNHQYVDPKHRGKGLGNIVERDLAKKCIKVGIPPCKTVVITNKNVVESAERSPFWTRWDYEEKPVVYVYLSQEKITN